MATESRPVCVYAITALRRNSTKLLASMCIGIALSVYGIYVQTRSQSNPSYVPTISMATHWLYNNLGNKLAHPRTMLSGCGGKSNTKQPHLLVRSLTTPMMHYSGIINAFIHLAQIILLKVHCRSLVATDVIIGLSVFGFVVSMMCLAGAYAACKMMCISCLGLQYAAIIYFAIRRRKMIQNMLCPSVNTNSSGACNPTSSSAGNVSGRIFGRGSSPASQGTNQASGSVRRRPVR